MMPHNKRLNPPLKDELYQWISSIRNINPAIVDYLIKQYYVDVNSHKMITKNDAIQYVVKVLLKFKKNYKPHTIEYWTVRGWSENDAKDKRLVRSKQWYIDNYGEIDGIKKWNELKSNISKNCGNTKEKFIKRHGDIEGVKKYETYRLNCGHTKQWYTDRYGTIEGDIRYTKLVNNMSRGEDWFVNKFGYDLGMSKYEEFCKSCSRNKKYYIDKFGDEIGTIKYDELKNKIKVNLGYTSKKSLEVFIPLYVWLKELIDETEIYYGHNNKKEYFLSANKQFYLYDFVIREHKIIIEYNGSAWHPNPNWESSKLEQWKHPITRVNATEFLTNYYNKKIELAQNLGFDILIIYEDDINEYNINKCKEFILNKLKND